MKSLGIVKTVEASFSGRSLCRLERSGRTESTAFGANTATVVTDLSISRKVLTSESFTSFNTLRDGMERLQETGRPAAHMSRFYEDGPLFREGDAHHRGKRRFKKLLDEQGAALAEWSPRLESFVGKRAGRVRNSLDFAVLFTRACFCIVVSNLTSASLTASMRAIRARRNVFYYYFHPGRHLATDAALAGLLRSVPASARPVDEDAWLLASSMLVMGYDPVVASICAALSDEQCATFAEAPRRFCPTSFVSRLCVQETSIADLRFRPGDICYVSLVPASGGESETTFPFGLGPHTCVGKQFSFDILALAEKIAGRCFPGGLDQVTARADGAFLCFTAETA